MAKRNHRVIREVSVPAGVGVFQFDLETEQFDALLVTWYNSEDAAAAPTSLIFCPGNARSGLGNPARNFPTPAALVMPVAGAAVYLSFGLSAIVAIPMPSVLTFGVVNSAGSIMSIRVEGDEFLNALESPIPVERARS